MEIMSTIAKVRRTMPRNSEVMSICDELEKRIITPAVKADPVNGSSKKPKKKFDKTAYMRTYMRELRAEAKKAKAARATKRKKGKLSK